VEMAFGSNATLPSVMVSTPLLVKRSSPLLVPLFMFIDSDCLNDFLRLGPGKLDRQQPVLQIRAQHMHPLRQHEGALEVARGDAAMDVLPGLVVLLAAPDHELVFLNGYIELVAGKSRHRQCDAQPFRLAGTAVAPLDVVRRITVGAFDDAIERTLDFVESQQKRTGQRRNTSHFFTKSSRSDFGISGPLRRPLATDWRICRPVNSDYGHDLRGVQAPLGPRQNVMAQA